MHLELIQSFEDILWVLVLIGVMINIHEAGHFWAARFFDVKVETFSFGFGKRLFGFRRGETDFRFSLIPFGGYVKMSGEQGAENSVPDDPRSLLAKPRWQRLIIAAAGPAMNVFLAIGLLTGLYMVTYPKLSHADEEAVIGDVLPDSPAAKAGIQPGDRIVKMGSEENPTWDDVKLKEAVSAYRTLALTVERGGRDVDVEVTPTLSERSGVGSAGWDKRGEVELYSVDGDMPAGKAGLKPGDVVLTVNGQTIDSVNKLHNVTETSGGKPLQILFDRDGKKRTVSVAPVFDKKDGPARWMIGVGPALKPHYIDTRLSFPAALNESLSENAKGATMIGNFLEGMVQRRMSAKNLTGPIGIAELSGDAAREGPSAYLGFMSAVSLNLAIFNLLPIPVLDGGLIMMLLVEMAMHRDLSLNVKEAVFKVGFVFIMLVVAFVLYNDISRYLPNG
ncbi:MAG TPA: RIP metalloprotease RseP [Bryobacteraceae bacterium]|nr:RIP metalloprotease RseP [Bryobacteraceae bacterium]